MLKALKNSPNIVNLKRSWIGNSFVMRKSWVKIEVPKSYCEGRVSFGTIAPLRALVPAKFYPATQSLKRERIEQLGLPLHENQIFAPIDFETETLREGLTRSGLNWKYPAF